MNENRNLGTLFVQNDNGEYIPLEFGTDLTIIEEKNNINGVLNYLARKVAFEYKWKRLYQDMVEIKSKKKGVGERI